MGLSRWLLLIYLFANLCTLVRPQGKYPDFFYDDSENVNKKHKRKPNLDILNIQMDMSELASPPEDPPPKPANALPEYESPPRPFYKLGHTLKTQNSHPRYTPPEDFKTIGRGDPKDQNLIQQLEMQEDDADSVFPRPDGKPFNDDDNFDLDELPKRLTQTNKWEEFDELIAAEKAKYKGKVLTNWHDNAHMWASYSRHLLKRDKKVQRKAAAALHTREKPKENPTNAGMSPYWSSPDVEQESPVGSPAVPWGDGKGPGAGIANMKDLDGPEYAEEPFPRDQAGGPGGMSMGGGPPGPPGLGQGGQFPGGDSNMGGVPPPGMGQGGAPGPGGQFPGGGFNMGGGMPSGMGQGGAPGPGGQFPGGGFNMGGGMPSGMGQGGAPGPGGQFPGGGFNMGGGMPSGMGQGGAPGPGGQFPGGGFNMGGGMPSGMGQGGAPGPGSQFPGGGFNMGGGMPSGMGQGGAPGPGGQFPGGGFNMGGGLPPGMGQGRGLGPGGQFQGDDYDNDDDMSSGMGQGGGPGPGGQFPGSGFNMGGGLPPGMGQGGGPGTGGQFPGSGFNMGGGLPPGMGQGGGPGPGGQFPGGGFDMGGGQPPGMGEGRGRGPGGQFPGGGFSMGGAPPSPGLKPGTSLDKNRIQGPGAGQGPDEGYGPVGPPGPAGGWVPGGGRGSAGGLGPGMGPGMGRGSGMARGSGRAPGPGRRPGKGKGHGPGGLPGPDGVRGPVGVPGMSHNASDRLDPNGGFGPVGPPGPAHGWVPAGGRGPGGGGGPGTGRGPGGPSDPDNGWGPGGRPPQELGQGPGIFNGPGGPPGTGGSKGPGGGPSPGTGGGPGGGQSPGTGGGPGGGQSPGTGGGPGGGQSPGTGGGPGGGQSPGTGGGPGGGQSPGTGGGPGGPPGLGAPAGPGRPPGEGRHRRSVEQSKKDKEDYMKKRFSYYNLMIQPTRTPDTKAPQIDDRFLIGHENDAEDNVSKQETNVELLKSLTATPKPSNPFIYFDKDLPASQVPTGAKGGKIPGPGSEADYPNGFQTNYAYPKQPSMTPPRGNYGMGEPHTGQAYPNAMAVRQGQGVNSGSPGDYQDGIPNALRMGQGPSDPAARQSFQPGMARGNMARGPLSGNIGDAPPPPPGYELRGRPPPGFMEDDEIRGLDGDPAYMQGGQPSRMRGGPPPGYMQGGPPSRMRGGPPPGYMQERQHPGMGGSPFPGYMQERQNPGMGGGPFPGYMQEGQFSGNRPRRPTSYEGFRRSLHNSTVDGGGYPESPGPFSGKPIRRQGGGLASDEWSPSAMGGGPPPGYLREGSPGGGPPPDYMQGGPPGGGSPGYMQGGPPGGGPPPDYMQGGPPGGGPPGYMQGGPPGGGSPPGYMQGLTPEGWPATGYKQGGPPGEGPPSGYMQGGPPGGGPPSGYMQGGPPSEMGGGVPPEFPERPKGPPAISTLPSTMQQEQMDRPPPGYGSPDGDDPSLRYGAQSSPLSNNTLPSGYQLMKIAQRKIEFQNRLDKVKGQPSGPTTQHVPTVDERLRALRQLDDFYAPIRWVRLNSPDTKDGLARVTDNKTHQNQQYVIEGELFVPIVDESMARLGWTTESYTETIVFTTRPNVEEHAITVVMRSMNLNLTTEHEWLAYETVLGAKFGYKPECAREACQSRCHKTGCDCTCKGDSCASGCVGVSCNAVCKGPGCNAMCIGEQCTAKCEGMSCEAQCWGAHCTSSCSLLSCSYTMNGGRTRTSNVTWDEMYPQYGQKISNPNPEESVPIKRELPDYGQPADDYYNN